MKFPHDLKDILGVAVPVSALRSKDSCGIGEFKDLKLLGDFCLKSEVKVIQILPVNDTGFSSSPYGALSAFALHPVYLRLDDLPGAGDFKSEIGALKKKTEKQRRVHFYEICQSKQDILQKIYLKNKDEILADKEIADWKKNSPWIDYYSVFCFLKDKNDQKSWIDWTENKEVSQEKINQIWKKEIEGLYYHVWLQYHLEQQLSESASYLQGLKIALKGDLPILMNEDSADVWFYRNLFRLDLRAGAPPDMFSSEGQNWSFPIYNWEEMEKNKFKWWKQRLNQAAKYYHAYRIDHVLGFFRLWCVDHHHYSGKLGFFKPAAYIKRKDLKNIGFNQARIKWLSEAHIPGEELRQHCGGEWEKVKKLALKQIANEDLYLFSKKIEGEKSIQKLKLSENSRNYLINAFSNRCLLQIDRNSFFPVWSRHSSRSWNSLSDEEKIKIDELINSAHQESEKIWEENGTKLLSFMSSETDMLVCAEDLGVIPDCVPRVLEKLNILGLRVCRWTRQYDKEADPFVLPSEYPHLSVSTFSVHDSSTLRQWWSEDVASRRQLCGEWGLEREGDSALDEKTAATLLSVLFQGNSALCILAIQDLFLLDQELPANDPASERINVPGTMNDSNWCYRIEHFLEDLIRNSKFIDAIKRIQEN